MYRGRAVLAMAVGAVLSEVGVCCDADIFFCPPAYLSFTLRLNKMGDGEPCQDFLNERRTELTHRR